MFNMFRHSGNWFYRLLGVAMILGGIIFTYNTAIYMINAEKTTGTVISVRIDRDGSSTKYKPMFSFATPEGEERFADADGWFKSNKFLPGVEASIYYNPEDLSEVKVNDFIKIWWFDVSFLLMGLAMVYMTWGFPSFRRRK